jgi:DNA-binding transcriptional ArsR family regulator
MAYSELIKSFEKIRDYMREFYVYGFKSREDYTKKSARSYDDERRRIESWLGGYMAFRRSAEGKNVFISVDNRSVPFNPLHNAWKAKSFTDKDIVLHFCILDLLADGAARSAGEITDGVAALLSHSERPFEIDESTVRKKLKEYAGEGLIIAEKRGRNAVYRRAETVLPEMTDALAFFSEVAPCGVIGSFLLDKTDAQSSIFGFKHHYITQTLDSEILLSLFDAMHEKREITITSATKKNEQKTCTLVPLRVFVSAQNGRQHLLAYVPKYKSRISSFRVDRIVCVEPGAPRADYDELRAELDRMARHMWGVSTHGGSGTRPEHVEFTVRYGDDEQHIHHRLEREKRCGTVERLDEHTSRFSADVYDAAEMVPWIRTFICRITSVSFSDPELQKRFLDDIREMYRLYGLEGGESV